MQRPQTQYIFEESCRLIPGGVNSPIRACHELKMLPLQIEKGSGEIIYDIDGNHWIDYCMSWGALPLGHAYPKVVEAVQKQMALGSSFGIPTPLEMQMAREIIALMPSIEKIRFVSSGTEAVMSAIRLSRAISGKPCLIKFNGCYHGHFDPLLIQAGSGVTELANSSSLGVTKETIAHTISLPYNDCESVKEAFRLRSDIGVVIVEPMAANMGLIPGTRAFLETLREETKKAGALLIFDEVITGFRIGLHGAQGHFGIDPDLTCLGKIIGGGLPAAAFGGKSCFMDFLAPLGGVYQAGTLSGNPLAMQAGLATLKQLQTPSFYSDLQEKADLLLSPLQEWIDKKNAPICLHRQGSLFTLFFGVRQATSKEDLANLDAPLFRKFYEYLFSRGIYFPPSQWEACFLSSAHTEKSLTYTRDSILAFFEANF
ncbi:MAG: glutamate-1-semialdehyde 2,1-aminomutase [Rhabdochlamydiaceae bacterium]|nr:glutamate-1-semialdehyde 2,1-aminomutase [Rhabdochlamydiaceae bacterium]